MTRDAASEPIPSELAQLCINTIRFLSVDAVQKANSGHPGMPMGAAAMAFVLWTRFLKHNPANPKWFDRDRFVLSAGHGSMLLYSLLHLTGYDLPLEEIKNFRQYGSITPGHPERGRTPGVEVTTGPLGQGFGNGVGLAIAEAHLAARFNRPGFKVINHHTYGIVSDGDLMEGVASEAASLAGHLRLGKLIYLYDDNRVSLASATDLCFTEDRAGRFEAYGWQVLTVSDGNDLAALANALETARQEKHKPSLIVVRTHIGYGSPKKQDSFEAHGSPLGPDEVVATKKALGWPAEPPFLVPDEARNYFRRALETGGKSEALWRSRLEEYALQFPDLARELELIRNDQLAPGWEELLPQFPADPKGMATRIAFGKALNAVAKRIPNLIGGSADLNPSTFTAIQDGGNFEGNDFNAEDRQGAISGPWGREGINVHFGVREHAMGAIVNGLGAHGGLIPYGATFLTFSDYLRPTLRLAALSGLRVLQIFTHDSIAMGEDGPTHQPVEHLASLRAIPQLTVIRPADANEASVALAVALRVHDAPVAIVLSRQSLPVLDRSGLGPAQGLGRGAYVLADPPGGAPDLLLIATGSEVPLALGAQRRLLEEGIKTRLVSMPSWELFENQPEGYRNEVLPPQVTARLAVEAASPMGWQRWVGAAGDVLGIERYGASAPGDVVLKEYGFTVDNICARARRLLGKRD
ncbi:transketolase [Geomesophilobacter sediminis]|uniref:Transketolase n=1 Tax=Geomesophilobacter sediminis TaxID=2798584 RepID=A0A8J7JAE0_9BACT|nr:transketolase [Geomesophilobacter sediminis]MBJ6723846.1 transketolase [Geomesophilobacter sediminis]